MNEADIRKYARLMGELGLTGLEIKDNETVVRLERSCGSSAAAAPVSTPAEQKIPQDESSAIVSPMVGIFYRAPAEDAEPFVKVGDTVRQGTVLCLIEAMKMMNEIVAEEDGTITEICVQNGQLVDFGRELFRIRR